MELELAQREPESCKIGYDAFLEICFCFSFVGDCSVCVSFLVDAMPESNYYWAWANNSELDQWFFSILLYAFTSFFIAAVSLYSCWYSWVLSRLLLGWESQLVGISGCWGGGVFAVEEYKLRIWDRGRTRLVYQNQLIQNVSDFLCTKMLFSREILRLFCL